MGGVVVSKADHPVIMKAPPGYQPLPALGVPMQVQVQTMPADAMQEDMLVRAMTSVAQTWPIQQPPVAQGPQRSSVETSSTMSWQVPSDETPWMAPTTAGTASSSHQANAGPSLNFLSDKGVLNSPMESRVQYDKCRFCGMDPPDHPGRNCPMRTNVKYIKCFFCGMDPPDHPGRDCPMKPDSN